MDLRLVREDAIEATTRFFWDKHGAVPDEDSEEWESEYRRQFELAKRRHAGQAPARAKPVAGAVATEDPNWPPLVGPPTQIRWAAALRAERLAEIRDPGIRDWLISTWTKASGWLNTRDLPTPVFLQRVTPRYAEYRRDADARAAARRAEEKAKTEAARAVRADLAAAGITPEGLIELIDASERTEPAPIKAKLAEVSANDRALRLFETAKPEILLVKEKNAEGQTEYGIERDDGLVEDLRRFAQVS